MLHVHRSNRAERLVERLAERMGRPLADPLRPEIVAVHSRGLQRWLAQQLSLHLGAGGRAGTGVCANVEYPFPAHLVQRILAGALGVDGEAGDPWAPDRLAWTILEVLPELLDRPELGPLRGYLRADAGPVTRRRLTLARRIAETFDRYAIYRPVMARAWSEGRAPALRDGPLPDDAAWQPILWHTLQERIRSPTLAERFERARLALARRGDLVPSLPERVHLFGLATLPPVYLTLLRALAHRHDVHLYLPCPSREYWGAIRSRADALAELADPDRVDEALAGQHNPLLAAFGRLARDFQIHLESEHGPDGIEDDPTAFEDPADVKSRPATMLELLQSDVLALRTRGAGGSEPPPAPAERDDRSIQIHACHGPTRQVEVLRDALWRLMEDPESRIEPRDIVVMTPDIETFAPVVAAVFGDDTAAGAPALPFSIADRGLRSQSPVAAALLQLLDLAQGRAPASAVVDLLRVDVVRARFDIAADDLPRIERWVQQSGIRWGVDAEHRGRHGQPEESRNTWRFGLDRLQLSVAMADDEERAFCGVVPCDAVAPDEVDELGRFAEFCETVFAQLEELARPRAIDGWADVLDRALERFVRVGEARSWLLQQVRDVLAELRDRPRRPDGTGFSGPVALDAAAALLAASLGRGPGTVGHQTGAITFCGMVPMRSIPHRVVCLLGMDDGAFPRPDAPPPFDLVARERWLGDRSPRDEDQFLLLEALLAARQNLIVIYGAHDLQTNEELPPAVPVGQLLDVLDQSFRPAPPHDTVRDQVTTAHPLQAFSPRNFDAAAPVGYDPRLLAAAQRLVGARTPPPPFFSAPLPAALQAEPGGPGGVLELADLIGFWDRPVPALLMQRLGLRLRREDTGLQDREPMEVDGLTAWRLADGLLAHRLHDRAGEWAETMRRRGLLPPGAATECALTDAAERVEQLLEASAAVRAAPRGEVAIDLDLGDLRLIGTVRPVFGKSLVRLCPGEIKPGYRLAQWIEFLALNAQRPDQPWEAWIFGRDRQAHIGAVARARAQQALFHLRRLAELYREGLAGPLPFFPQASWIYATQRFEGDTDERAREKAGRVWHAGRGKPGDGDEPHHALVFGPASLWAQVADDRFAALAQEVWRPILDAEARG